MKIYTLLVKLCNVLATWYLNQRNEKHRKHNEEIYSIKVLSTIKHLFMFHNLQKHISAYRSIEQRMKKINFNPCFFLMENFFAYIENIYYLALFRYRLSHCKCIFVLSVMHLLDTYFFVSW